MLVFRQFLQNQTQNFLEFFLTLWLHIASNMFSLMFKLPFKARILLTSFIDRKSHRIHVQMNGKLILFCFVALELDAVLIIAPLRKGDGA